MDRAEVLSVIFFPTPPIAFWNICFGNTAPTPPKNFVLLFSKSKDFQVVKFLYLFFEIGSDLKKMILSLHPHFRYDLEQTERLSLAGNQLFESKHARLMRKARAVVVPQGITKDQYAFCAAHARRIFPDYTHRFGFEGKIGNFYLFQKFNLPHPKTVAYESVNSWPALPPFSFPFVMKADCGGAGFGVFLVHNIDDIKACLDFFNNSRKNSTRRFVAQEFINHNGRDLRVVLIGNHTLTYWRCQNKAGEFRNNVGKGAVIDPKGDPDLTRAGIKCVQDLKQRTNINLAACDVLFDAQDKKAKICEINFVFGRKGIGGTPAFRNIFNKAASTWIESET